MRFIFALICLLNMTMAYANPQSAIWYTHGVGEEVNIHVDLFLSSTCPHCIKADAFFHEVEKKKPWLVVHRYVINQDKLALQTFYDRLQQQNSTDFSVPAIFFCGSRWTGFSDANTTGRVLLRALSYCHKKISQQGELSPGVINVLQKEGDVSQFYFGANVARSTPLLIISTALMDAFNPCSLFCFVAFLAFLWLYPTQKWLQFSVGIIFLLSLGVIHYVQQAHPAFYYQMILQLRLSEMIIGLLLLFFMWSTYLKMMSHVVLKPGLLVFSVIILTAFAIQISQQTCVFNVALVLEQWWTDHVLSPEKHVFYQVIYQVFYILPLAFLLLFYLKFGRHQRMTAHHQTLNIAAYFMLMSISVILLVYPQWLANILVSIAVPVASIVVGWLIKNYRSRYE